MKLWNVSGIARQDTQNGTQMNSFTILKATVTQDEAIGAVIAELRVLAPGFGIAHIEANDVSQQAFEYAHANPGEAIVDV